MRRLNFIARLCVCAAWAIPHAPSSQDPSSADFDWWTIDRGVAEQLFERDVGEWARALEAEPLPADAGRLLERFAIAYRAGHDAWSRAIVDALAALDPAPTASQLSAAVDRVIDREHWDLARYFLERLPNAEPGWGYVLVRRWSDVADADTIDRWLAARAERNRGYWLRERLRFRSDRGSVAPLIAELAAAVRARPTELAPALDYLEALRIVGPALAAGAWLGEVCRPCLAFESYDLGAQLAGGWPRAAIALLDHSLATPFTDADREAVERIPMAVHVPNREGAEQLVRAWTRNALLQACKAAGETERAQRLLEELAATSPAEAVLPLDSRLAGAIQAESGARVIEGRILAAEPKRETDYEYWLERAEYFDGRGERAETDAAFERALSLTQESASEPKKSAHARTFVVGRYVSYSAHRGEIAACRAFLWQELADADLASEHAAAITRHLHEDVGAASQPDAVDDKRWWSYLAARTQWNYGEEKLLMRLAESTRASKEAREALWSRATALAQGDPSRALVLGWVMTRHDANSRAIPLLADAEARAADDEHRVRAAFTRFEAGLALGDWRAAERAWPSAQRELMPHEAPEWLGRIAIIAARAGATDDALRIWSQRTNLDRAELRGLDDMVRAGALNRLVAFYEQLALEDPASSSPARALTRLRERR